MTIIRFTRQRQAVLECVRASREHPDAAAVFAEVRQVLPSISLGTVYRSLDALVQDGQLFAIQRAGEATRYDARLDDHVHFICDKCGHVFDAYVTLPSLQAAGRNKVPGFQLTRVLVEYHGVCGDCAHITEA
ncbi:MAG TPA: transcriptional repressor [Deinococcales bacterium]|nr:transcriptional repressor [Deinococcales bacterium]